VFLVTVFAAHLGLARACMHHEGCATSCGVRRGAWVAQGNVIDRALQQEGISREDLEAGLRKLGFDSPAAVELAVLEETGHISAVARKG